MSAFENRVAVVTGSRLGIGKGVARLLAERGAVAVLVNRSDASELAAELGRGAVAIAADVTSEDDWARVAATVDDRFGRSDILVNAAGIYPTATLTEMSYAEWRRVLATNLDSQFLGARALVPLMRRAGWDGSSTSHLTPSASSPRRAWASRTMSPRRWASSA